jgi:hypothetical protein
VVAVGGERGAANLLAGTDAKDGHGLVADKADHRGGGHGRQVLHGPRVEQTADRLVAGDDGAEAVIINPTNDHFTAQMPRSVATMDGSTAPWVWPCRP